MSFSKMIKDRTRQLADEADRLTFAFDGYIYNPLDYAWELHSRFLEKYVKKEAQVILLGMNPGPFGMMQTGVPFGEVNAVVNYLKISGNVGKPSDWHPARPVLGLECPRSEVSGRRLWGLVASKYENPEDFATVFSVFNYCPLGFIENTKTAKNITPDHLNKEERKSLDEICNRYLMDIVEEIKPRALIGVGKYAEEKFSKLFPNGDYLISSIIHPSPGNPMANNGWAEKTDSKLKELALWK